MPQILITLMDDSVIASETATTHQRQLTEILLNKAKDIISDAHDRGDVRTSLRLRTVYVDLQK